MEKIDFFFCLVLLTFRAFQVSLPWCVLVAERAELRALLPRFGESGLSAPLPPFKRSLLHKAVLVKQQQT